MDDLLQEMKKDGLVDHDNRVLVTLVRSFFFFHERIVEIEKKNMIYTHFTV